MNLETGLTLLGGAVGGGKVIEKILGPTSEYLGNQMKEWAEKKVKNVSNIFKNAESKLGDKINQGGAVPPKVLRGILEEGAWCEEQLQVEYFGGVLASSRSGVSRDDRGAYFTSLISRLTTYQIRVHYTAYHMFKQQFNGQDININDGDTWNQMQIFIPFETFIDAMDYSIEEQPQVGNILSHSMWGLYKEDLISDFFYGNKEALQTRSFKDAPDGGVLITPSKLGVELFMMAYGYGQMNSKDFFLPSVQFKLEADVKIGNSLATRNDQSSLFKEK